MRFMHTTCNADMTKKAYKLGSLDSCAISDAMDRLGISGTARDLRPLTADIRIWGRCVTVQLAPVQGTGSKRHLCTTAIDASGAGDVIVVAHDGRLDVAGWGGLLSLSAKLRNIEGAIVDGACRDIDESRELIFPIYARSAIPTTARSRIMEKAWNVDVVISGVPVKPGDFVIADGSGVIFIPEARIEEVLAVAERIAGRERLMATDLRAGKPVSEVMGIDYERMLADGQ